jgi:hypothetical protein
MHLSSLFSATGRRARLRSHLFAAAAAVVVLTSLGTGPSALAANAGPGRALGLLAVHGDRHGSGRTIGFSVHNVSKGGGGGKGGKGATGGGVSLMTYHGGSIFNSPWRVYDIYWVPPGYTVASGYQSTIDGFFQNVAADSGKTSNVFSTATQYTDTGGSHVAYNATFGGSTTLSNPFPASGCTDSALASAPCLTDNQVAAEINTAAATNGWTVGYPNIFVVMMPKGVGNCATYSTGGLEGYCSFATACAWHHQWGGMYFVVQPYVGNVPTCESGQTPSGGHDASQAINTASHELSENLTDPAAGSWFDVSGYEIGDKCAWAFGTALGGGTGTLYNQVINGVNYFLQQEWSNQSSGCVQRGT